LPIEKYYTPAEFERLRAEGEALGLARVESGPLVRSSYHARRALEGPSA
jgi:lipoic acid synthetase